VHEAFSYYRAIAIPELHKAHTNATTHMRLISMRERPDIDKNTDKNTNTDTAADIDTQITKKRKGKKGNSGEPLLPFRHFHALRVLRLRCLVYEGNV
jgi:hypothetical protein